MRRVPPSRVTMGPRLPSPGLVSADDAATVHVAKRRNLTVCMCVRA